MQSYDVIVVGGGMVGLAVAVGLQTSGLSIAVLEPTPPAPSSTPTLRVSALHAGSQRLLAQLGAWPTIAPHAPVYHGIDVWEKDSFGRIIFRDRDYGLDGLGYIVENAVIQSALWQQAEAASAIALFPGVQPERVVWGEQEAFVQCDAGQTLTGRLLIAADGAHSWLRQQADIPLTFRDYRHHALIATIQTEQPHHTIARQTFHEDGILALLPLADPHHCSIVWSLPPEQARALLQADAQTFNRRLTVTFDGRAGRCQLISERQCFPLRARYARNFAAHRLALVGDAAHTIHPLAGQGVNLGFMDAAHLIEELRRLHARGKDIGQYACLRPYERQRKLYAARMLAGMQLFHDLFAGGHPLKKWLRGAGLKLTEQMPLMKAQFIRQATGLSELPDWLLTTDARV